MSRVPHTSIDAFRAIREAGEDVNLRLRLLALTAIEPRTSKELEMQVDNPVNTVTARMNELIRRGLVVRRKKRENPSGHDAYVNEVTDLGRRVLRGEVPEPDPDPSITDRQRKVVEIARRYLNGEVDRDFLQLAVERHDETQRALDPGWEPRGDDP